MNRKELIFYERLAAGDFSYKMMDLYNRRLGEKDKAIIEKIREENDKIRATYPMDIYKHQIIQKANIRSRFNRQKIFNFLRICIPALSCLAVLIFAVNILYKPTPTIKAKGKVSPSFSVYLKTRDNPLAIPEQVNNFSFVNEGDVLQITYKPEAGKYGFVFSIDGRREVTYIHPAPGPDQSKEDIIEPFELEKDGGSEVPLPYSYTLDDAPDCEVIFFIVSEKSFNPGEKTRQVLETFSFYSSGFSPVGEMEFIILLKKEGKYEENN